MFTGAKTFWVKIIKENETCSLCPVYFSVRFAALNTN
jgi:hypothetical protein